MRTKIVTMTALLGMLVATSVSGQQLLPGGWSYHPNLTATFPALSPSYTQAPAPAWFIPGNQVDALTAEVFPGIPNASFQGTVTSVVYQDPVGGALGFYYQVLNSGTLNSGIKRFDIGGIWHQVDISSFGSDTNGASTAMSSSPNWTDGSVASFQRDSVLLGSEPCVRWDFAPYGTELLSGDSSADLWFVTDAQEWGIVTGRLDDSGVSAWGSHLAPVPEPGTLTLLLLGGLVALARRRRKVTA